MKAKVSIIVGIRNRKENLIKFLDSFIKQNYPKNNFELIVVDYGGDDNIFSIIKKFNDNLNVKYFYINTNLPWNEARAKNIGIRKASNDFIICTNVDIVFEKNLLKKIMPIVEKNKKIFLYHLARIDILQDGTKLSILEGFAKGDFQGMHKKNWMLLRGYDESMTGWGGLDPDLYKRALRNNIKEFVFDNKKIQIFHNFHEIKPHNLEGYVNFWKMRLNNFFKINQDYFGDEYHVSKGSILKNFLASIMAPPYSIYCKITKHNII